MPVTDPWLPSGTVPSSRAAIPFAVYRITGSGPYTYDALPNVRCVAVESHEGGAPPSALFRYAFDGRDPDGPQSVEEALSTSFTGAHVVAENDRLGVLAGRPDGAQLWVFDGFALNFECQLSGNAETVAIHAVGTAKRAWDAPLGGALMNNADAPETVAAVTTNVVARFNPKGVANACAGTADAGSGDYTYPVFTEPGRSGTDGDGNDYPRPWTLPMAVAYATFAYYDPAYVAVPTRAQLNSLLLARKPRPGVPYDPNDAGTYDTADILAPDAPLTGRAWPNVVHELVRDSGFGVRWELSTDLDGAPVNTLKLWLKQAADPKVLALQSRFSVLDPALSNVGGAALGRDLTEVVNSWRVRGALDRYEVSLVLAPSFPSQASDSASAAALAAYDVTDPAFATSDAYDAYRTFVFNEDGAGYYANASTSPVTTVPSLDGVLGAGNYAVRRRAPVGQLFAVDSNGKPLPFRVAVSHDYAGTYPAVWDGTGHWRPVKGVSLLKDRIGVRINDSHANEWKVGKSDDSAVTAELRQAVLKVVECLGNPTTANPAFFVRLTCVIEADLGLSATADRTAASPVTQTVTREVDASDRYARQYRYGKSEFKSTTGNDTVRDDTAAATAEATALRLASEAGVFDGQVEIPRFTAYYEIGDRISAIEGRNLGLRTDGGGSDWSPVYPVVVSVRWDLDGVQRTVLRLSDAGLDRRRFAVKSRGRRSPGETRA